MSSYNYMIKISFAENVQENNRNAGWIPTHKDDGDGDPSVVGSALLVGTSIDD